MVFLCVLKMMIKSRITLNMGSDWIAHFFVVLDRLSSPYLVHGKLGDVLEHVDLSAQILNVADHLFKSWPVKK